MHKEEMPTFLNEQPTIAFGRTAREMLIIACGCVATYSFWGILQQVFPFLGVGGFVVHLLISVLPLLLSLLVALVSIAERPLEEWMMVLLLYAFLPKLFLYTSLDEEGQGDNGRMRQRTAIAGVNDEDEAEIV